MPNHEPQLTLDKTPTCHTCENGTVIKYKAVLSSVEKPRNLTYREWVFSQTLPAEWRETQIYSVIKIVFFHFIFHYVASFFPLLQYSVGPKEVSLYLSTQRSWDIT